MPKIALKKNDLVVVIRGKDKGKTGQGPQAHPRDQPGHRRTDQFLQALRQGRPQPEQQGGVMEKEAPIAVANVMLYCSECGQGVRARTHRHEDGSKIRLCHRCETLIEKQK